MTQTLILLAVFLVSCLGSWASFTAKVRQSPHYLGVMIAISVLTGALFAAGCQYLDDKRKIFYFSLYYDVMVATAYYALPLAFFGCRVSPQAVVGGLAILIGVFLLHAGSK